MIGIIKKLKERFGFIESSNGTQYFFHQSDLVDCQFRELIEDRTEVEFEPVESSKGPRAGNVRLL